MELKLDVDLNIIKPEYKICSLSLIFSRCSILFTFVSKTDNLSDSMKKLGSKFQSF